MYDVLVGASAVYARAALTMTVDGAGLIPAQGPVILAPNHFSVMDHFLIAVAAKRRIRFMAKSQYFGTPVGAVFLRSGAFPVQRGASDEESIVTALSLLSSGQVVGVYCEGGRVRGSRVPPRAKAGVGRLALTTGAPVVPVGIRGTDTLWKRPWSSRSMVQIAFGTPLTFAVNPQATRRNHQDAADAVLEAIRHQFLSTAQATA